MKLRLFYDYKDKSTKVELISQMYVGKMYVPKGFISDGRQYSSFVLETVFTFGWQIFAAHIFGHDFIYKTGLRSRKDADIFLRKNLERNGMCFLGRWTVYFSVRLFGWLYYKTFQ